MKELSILPTLSTPEIILRPDGFIRIRGRSINRNISLFSSQIEDWLDKYLLNPAEITCVDFYLEYFNALNLNYFISLFRKIESVTLNNKKYIINWYYDEGDEDMLEQGEYISSILDIPFRFLKVNDPLLFKVDTLRFNLQD